MNITFKRYGIDVVTVKITDSSYVNRNAMSDCTAYIEFFAATPVDLQTGDKVVLLGRTYFVSDPVIPERDKNRLIYKLTLYGMQYELELVKYFVADSTGVDETADTTWNCTPAEFLLRLVINMNRVDVQYERWHTGDCMEGPAKDITLANNNCLEMLQKAAELWETDYDINEYTISLKKTAVSLTPMLLETGKGKGLREITANKSGDSSVITCLYAYGSDVNMTTHKKLAIDAIYAEGATHTIEGIKDFPEIFPRVVAEIAEFAANPIFINPLPFNLDDYKIPGYVPFLKFLTGELMGIEFDFTITTITIPVPPYSIECIYLNQFELTPGVIVPGAPGFNPAVGDKFVVSNIIVPDLYVAIAQDELLAAATAWLATASKQKIKLNILTDDIYFQEHAISIELGDTLKIKSDIIPQLYTGLSVNVIGYKQFITRPYKYESLVVGDVYFSRPFNEKVATIINNTVVYKSTSTGSDSYFRHSQTVASASWTVIHNLGKRPAVMVTNPDGSEKEGKVTYLTMNTLRIDFSVPGTGSVECN